MKRPTEHRRKRLCHRIAPKLNAPVILCKRLVNRRLPSRKKILRIKTEEIRFFIYNDFLNRNCTFQGDVKGGDWDLNVRTREDILANTDKYRGLHEHFGEGIAWEKTTLFMSEYRKRIDSGRIIKGAKTLEELAKVYEKKYDTLFEQLRENGFLSPEEQKKIDPIFVYIGREGEIIYTSNGNHRLAMALELGIEEIPVRVWWRHKEWQRTRQLFAKLGKSEREKRYPHLIGHPDLADL